MKAFIRHFGGVSLLATAAQATSRNCRDINVPVTISSENLALPFPPPQSDIEVTNFILANVQMDPSSPLPPPQFINISGTFDLMTTYCEPESGPSKALQILTHGIGFDRSYWDFDYNQHNYSYVNFALDHGYSTLSWDRLGLGMSSHLDPIKQMQTPLEVAALAKLSSMAWDGLLPEIESSFEKIIHVGHSYGSSITYSLSVTSPQLTDGVVLTGFTHARDTAGLAPIALHLVDAQSRSEYAHGYTLQGDKTAVHTIFFSPGNFDSAVLDAVYEASQPCKCTSQSNLKPSFGQGILTNAGKYQWRSAS